MVRGILSMAKYLILLILSLSLSACTDEKGKEYIENTRESCKLIQLKKSCVISCAVYGGEHVTKVEPEDCK